MCYKDCGRRNVNVCSLVDACGRGVGGNHFIVVKGDDHA